MNEGKWPGPLPVGGVVLFDGECAVCHASRRYVERRDPDGRFRFVALGSEEGEAWLSLCGLDPQRRDTMVLVEPVKGSDDAVRCTMQSTAALRVVKRVKGPSKLMYGFVVVPRPLRDAVYRSFSRNRSRIWRVTKPLRREKRDG